MTRKDTTYEGGCLCGQIRFRVTGTPIFPHLCSCTTCQAWSGAPTVAWVEFPLETFAWIGPGGAPALFASSEKTQRGFCSRCGSTICALDDGYENISLTIAVFDDPSRVVPDAQHSFEASAPAWWQVNVVQHPEKT